MHLNPRDRDLIRLSAMGWDNKRIAVELGIAEGTVKTYFGRLLSRFAMGRPALPGLGLLLGIVSIADITREALDALEVPEKH